MIGVVAKFTDERFRVLAAMEKAIAQTTGRLAGRIRKMAIASIVTRPKSKHGRRSVSPVGSPPQTRRGQIRRAIRFEVNRTEGTAVIGPVASLLGTAGKAHEFGGRYKQHEYPQRPFMAPALKSNIGSFAGEFHGTLGQ